MERLFSIMSNLQNYYDFKLDFQKVEQYIGDKWLIHGTKHPKDKSVAKPGTGLDWWNVICCPHISHSDT